MVSAFSSRESSRSCLVRWVLSRASMSKYCSPTSSLLSVLLFT